MVNSIFLLTKGYKKYFVIFSGLVVFSLFFLLIHYTSKNEAKVLNPVFQISDHIPLGFVMVPIELENHESINELIASHGVVDLYYKSEYTITPYKFAQAVRIVRLQTQRFSVLIPEDQVADFLKSPLVFHAVVQNPTAKGSVIHVLQKKRLITVEDISGL